MLFYVFDIQQDPNSQDILLFGKHHYNVVTTPSSISNHVNPTCCYRVQDCPSIRVFLQLRNEKEFSSILEESCGNKEHVNPLILSEELRKMACLDFPSLLEEGTFQTRLTPKKIASTISFKVHNQQQYPMIPEYNLKMDIPEEVLIVDQINTNHHHKLHRAQTITIPCLELSFTQMKKPDVFPNINKNLSSVESECTSLKYFKLVWKESTSRLESFLLYKKIKGPCWLKISSCPTPVTRKKAFVSTCPFESIISYHHIEFAKEENENLDIPYMNVAYIDIESFPTRISWSVYRDVWKPLSKNTESKVKVTEKKEEGQQSLSSSSKSISRKRSSSKKKEKQKVIIDNQLIPRTKVKKRVNSPLIKVYDSFHSIDTDSHTLLDDQSQKIGHAHRKTLCFSTDDEKKLVFLKAKEDIQQYIDFQSIDVLVSYKWDMWYNLKERIGTKYALMEMNLSIHRLSNKYRRIDPSIQCGVLWCDAFELLASPHFFPKFRSSSLSSLYHHLVPKHILNPYLQQQKKHYPIAWLLFYLFKKYHTLDLTFDLAKESGSRWQLIFNNNAISEMVSFLLYHSFHEANYLLRMNKSLLTLDEIQSQNPSCHFYSTTDLPADHNDDNNEDHDDEYGSYGTTIQNLLKPLYDSYDNPNPDNIIHQETILLRGAKVLEAQKGIHPWVFQLDFKSYYPSIVVANNLCPSTIRHQYLLDCQVNDLLQLYIGQTKTTSTSSKNRGVLPHICHKLIQKRSACQTHLDALVLKTKDQQKQLFYQLKRTSLKLLVNSLYGCLGNKQHVFYSPALALMITSFGQLILLKACEKISQLSDVEVIGGDTDSLTVKCITTLKEKIQDKTLSFQQKHELIKDRALDIISKDMKSLFPDMTLELDQVYMLLMYLENKKYVGIPLFGINAKVEYLTLDQCDWKGVPLYQHGLPPFITLFRQKILLDIMILFQDVPTQSILSVESLKKHTKKTKKPLISDEKEEETLLRTQISERQKLFKNRLEDHLLELFSSIFDPNKEIPITFEDFIIVQRLKRNIYSYGVTNPPCPVQVARMLEPKDRSLMSPLSLCNIDIPFIERYCMTKECMEYVYCHDYTHPDDCQPFPYEIAAHLEINLVYYLQRQLYQEINRVLLTFPILDIDIKNIISNLIDHFSSSSTSSCSNDQKKSTIVISQTENVAS